MSPLTEPMTSIKIGRRVQNQCNFYVSLFTRNHLSIVTVCTWNSNFFQIRIAEDWMSMLFASYRHPSWCRKQDFSRNLQNSRGLRVRWALVVNCGVESNRILRLHQTDGRHFATGWTTGYADLYEVYSGYELSKYRRLHSEAMFHVFDLFDVILRVGPDWTRLIVMCDRKQPQSWRPWSCSG
jgi:hypothetical protein